MKLSRDNQQTLADIVLRVLARGICAVSLFDKRVADDIGKFGDGFSFSIHAGAGENSPAIRLKSENGRFVRANMDSSGDHVTIRFKDVSGAVPVLLGKTSIEIAFAQHRMIVWGNINQAVALVRIIGTTEAYLFPKFIIKKAMRRVPKKQAPSLFVYVMLLFFGLPKPPRSTENTAAGEGTPLDIESGKADEGLGEAK